MNIRHYGAAVVATLLLAGPGSAQSAADLLQQGIHAQETVGDLDGAIAIFRQVVAAPSTNKLLAAQAQYQLVLCLLQKGDRTSAAKEIQALEKDFPDQPDLLNKARRAMGGGETFLPAPWGGRETVQLNIKRDGAPTGETLFYSVEPDLGDGAALKPNPQAAILTWELNTTKTNRSVTLEVDRDTMRPMPLRGARSADPRLESDDDMGDPAAKPLIGPLIDIQGSVFLLRRLPLAVGYKTTLTSLPFAIGETAPRKLDLDVTGIEAVQTSAGKYNCYKVVFGAIGQTFWFNVDASRMLVKFQSGNVAAEAAAAWVGEDLAQAVLAPLNAAGWHSVTNNLSNHSHYANVWVTIPNQNGSSFALEITKTYTPTAEIPQSLQQTLHRKLLEGSVGPGGPEKVGVRANGIQTFLIGGQQALSCVADSAIQPPERPKSTFYIVLIQTENTLAEVTFSTTQSFAPVRWKLDQILSTVKLP
jgi:hypothetical protein